MMIRPMARYGRAVRSAGPQRRILKITVGAAAVAALFQTVSATAADPVTLPSIVVIGTTPLVGATLVANELPAPVQTATAADLTRSQSLDLSSFLNRNFSGVHINEMQNNPFQPDLNYRGYTASPLLGTPQGLSIYVDGVRMNQPFGDVVSWDLIPRAAIASMTLMPGSNPLFGLNTLGGALSIQTKDGLSNPGSAIQATYGANQRRSLEIEHGGSNANGLNWYITGNDFKENGWRDDSPSAVRQLFGKLGWADASTSLSLSLSHANNSLTGNGLQDQRLLERDYRSVYTKPDITNNRATSLNFAGTHRFNEQLQFSGNMYYRKIKTVTINGDLNDETLEQSVYQTTAAERAALAAAGLTGFRTSGADRSNTPFPSGRCIANVLLNGEPAEKCNGLINGSRTDQQNHGLSGQFTFDGKLAGQRNQFTAGAGYDASRVDFTQASQFGYLNPDRSITPVDFFADGTEIDEDGVPVDNRVNLNGRVRTLSLFATDTLSVNDLHLTLSGRYNQTRVTNHDRLNPGGGSGSLDGDYTYRRFNPAAGLAYTPSRAFNAYLGYNEGSRTPTAIELGCADPANPCKLPNSLAGDPPLNQVVTKTWEAGLRGVITTGPATTSWNAGVFRAENYDDLLFVALNQGGFGYFKNFGKTRRQGLELGLDSKIGKLDAGASLTLLDATYQSAEIVNGASNSSNNGDGPGFEGNIDIKPGNRIPLIPRQILKAHLDYQFNSAWSAGLAMNAVSGAIARGNENDQHVPDGTHYLGSGRSAGYTVFDLNARYRATKQLSFFMQINNLLDRRYATAAQLGATAFDAAGNFAARPLPAVNGAFPLVHSTFQAPGAPRAVWVGMRYVFGT